MRVPKEAKSIFEESLAEEYVAKFSTPTVKILQTLPSGRRESSRDHAVNTIIIVVFDQVVDADAVLKTVKLFKKKSEWCSPRLATPEEAKLTNYLKEFREGCFIIFTPTKAFPYGTKITVKLVQS